MAETTCPVFRPTEQEFKSFRRYIEDVVDPIAGKAGLCKVIPPPGWAASRSDAAEEMCKSVHIPAPIRQCVSSTRSNGVYSVHVVEESPMSLAEFKEYADKRVPFPSSTADAGCPGSAAVGVRRGRSGTASPVDAGGKADGGSGGGSKAGRAYGSGYGAGYGGGKGGKSGAPPSGGAGTSEESEVARRVRMFWRSLGPNTEAPIYGADTLGTLFAPDDEDAWNVARLDTILQLLKANLPGITTPMLYAGMWRSMFAFHVEDVNLYSINYVHRGDPKSWYGIPPDSRQRFESLAQAFFAEEFHACKDHMRHKTTMISPIQIQKAGISYYTAVQEAGEFMITFPGAYHGGFNHGFNLAESTNFALDRWIREGRGAGYCRCSPHSVRIDVDRFETLVRQHRRIAGKESTCLNGLAEAPDGGVLLEGQAADRSRSDAIVDARSTAASNEGSKSLHQGEGSAADGGSVDDGADGSEDSEDDSDSEEEEEKWEVDQTVQVFHCVCSNTRAVRRVRWTEGGGFVPVPYGNDSSGASAAATAAAAAAWPEDQDCAECPRCGVWGHKACLEYVVPAQYAIPEAGEGFYAVAAAPQCSNGVQPEGGARDESDPEASSTGGRGDEEDVGAPKPDVPSAPASVPPPPRPVCWMCMQEKAEVAAMEAGTGGGDAAAAAPRRAGKSSGGSNSGAGGGGGGACGASRGGEADGGGNAKKKGAKRAEAKIKSGGGGDKGAESKSGKRRRNGEADGGGGGSAAGKKAGPRAGPSSAGVRTVAADPAAPGTSKRARVGPRLLGKEVLVSDGVAAVLTGVVTAIEAGQARVHYRGRKAKLDEWIDVRSERFLSAAEAKKQIELTHLAMNPSAAAPPAPPSTPPAGKKRKATSASGSKSATAGPGGKRAKIGGDGGSTKTTGVVKKPDAKKSGDGKSVKARAADGDKIRSGTAKANAKENKAADGGGGGGGGGATPKKDKKPAGGGAKKAGVAGKPVAAARRKLPPKQNGKTKPGTTPAQHKTSTGEIGKRDNGGSGGGGGGRNSGRSGGGGSGGGGKTAGKEVKKPKKPKKPSSIKPVAIPPPVVVQREVPEHHVISSRRAAVLARTFAKETEEAQKDFEEAVAAAERSRLARQQRRKSSSSPRGGSVSRQPPPSSSQGAAPTAPSAPAATAEAGNLENGGHPAADESTHGEVAGAAERWPDLGFGGQPWGLGPFVRDPVGPGRDASAVWASRANGTASSGYAGLAGTEEGGQDGDEEGEQGEGDGEESVAATAAGVAESLRRPLKEMRRARVEHGQAVDLGEEPSFRKWLARLRAVQYLPVGHVEACSRSLALLLGTSPPDGSIRASIRALLVAESTRGGASHEVAALVRRLAGLIADAATKARPLPAAEAAAAAAATASEDAGHTGGQAFIEQSQGARAAAADNSDGGGGGGDDTYPAAESIQDEEGAAAYTRALAHLARERSRQKQAVVRAAQKKAEAEAAVVAAAVGLENARTSNKGNKSKRISRATRRHAEAVEAAEALVLPASEVPPPAVDGAIPGGYPFSRSGDALLMHTKAMVGLKRTERWASAWLRAPTPFRSPPSRTAEAHGVGPRKPRASSGKRQKRQAPEEKRKKDVTAENASPFGAGAPFAPPASASPCVAAAAVAAASARQPPSVAAGVVGWQNAFVPLQRYPPPAPGIAEAVLSSAPAMAPTAFQSPVVGTIGTAASAAAAAAAAFATGRGPTGAAAAPGSVHHRPYGGLSTDSAYNALLSWWSPQLSGASAAAGSPPAAAPNAQARGAATAASSAHLTSGETAAGHPAEGADGAVEGNSAGVDLLERWERVGAVSPVQPVHGASGVRQDEDMVIVDV
eukprot:g4377.t1